MLFKFFFNMAMFSSSCFKLSFQSVNRECRYFRLQSSGILFHFVSINPLLLQVKHIVIPLPSNLCAFSNCLLITLFLVWSIPHMFHPVTLVVSLIQVFRICLVLTASGVVSENRSQPSTWSILVITMIFLRIFISEVSNICLVLTVSSLVSSSHNRIYHDFINPHICFS